jgi:nucleoside phosphorylase
LTVPLAATPAGSADSLRGRRGTAIAAILTVIEEEFAAAREVFDTSKNVEGTHHFAVPGAVDNHVVITSRCSGRGNVPALQAVQSLIEDFRPRLLVLMGIAGGVRGRDQVRLGDVVLADHIDYSEYGKLTDKKFLLRREPLDHPSYHVRHNVADPARLSDDWRSHIRQARPYLKGAPRVLLGNVVAGEKVFADQNSKYQRTVMNLFDKAIAVDMESWGFARGLFGARASVHYNPQCLVIRGISDYVDEGSSNQRTRDRWKVYAASTAAAFTRAVVDAFCHT